MKPDITIAVDAGGTYLKAGVLRQGCLIPELCVTKPSCSNGSADEIVSNLAGVIWELASLAISFTEKLDPSEDKSTDLLTLSICNALPCFQIGIGFPGPFEYETGISRIRGLNKYEHLYGRNLKALLKHELVNLAATNSVPSNVKRLADADIWFGNDAVLFALGISRLFPEERLLCLTLGTGLGSAFIDNMSIMRGRPGIPDSGMLYGEFYKGEQIDDLFGSRGIRALAEGLHSLGKEESIYDLAVKARNGISSAARVWQLYGQRLGDMLRPYATEFRPARLILGGQIAGSYDLFGSALSEALLPEQIPVQVETKMPMHVFHGIFQLIENSHSPF